MFEPFVNKVDIGVSTELSDEKYFKEMKNFYITLLNSDTIKIIEFVTGKTLSELKGERFIWKYLILFIVILNEKI